MGLLQENPTHEKVIECHGVGGPRPLGKAVREGLSEKVTFEHRPGSEGQLCEDLRAQCSGQKEQQVQEPRSNNALGAFERHWQGSLAD